MENQPPQTTPFPSSSSTPPLTSTTSEWPTLPPPPPIVIKPTPPLNLPDPPVLATGGGDADASSAPVADVAAAAAPDPTAGPSAGAAPSATAAAGVGAPSLAASRQARPALGAEESPLLALQRAVRRQQAANPRDPRKDLVWQPRFAYASALVILLALTLVSMPLWIVLYRITGAEGAPRVADVAALCMMLLGAFLAGAAAWVIIIEMRGRVRMVDTLAKTGEREAVVAPVAPELPVLDAPVDTIGAQPIARSAVHAESAWDPTAQASLAARIEAQQRHAAAMLEASSKLLAAFSGVLKSFGQLPAQAAMLAVALALFVGATVLSLN